MSTKKLVHSAGICIVDYSHKLALPPKYLLLRCFSYWDFPKGELDASRDFFATALRETEEETNLPPSALHFDWGKEDLYEETEPYKTKKGHKIARYYLARIDLEKKPSIYLPVSEELGKPEHDEFRWMTFEESKEKLSDRVSLILSGFHEIVMGNDPSGLQKKRAKKN